jgi:hypothetical protein
VCPALSEQLFQTTIVQFLDAISNALGAGASRSRDSKRVKTCGGHDLATHICFRSDEENPGEEEGIQELDNQDKDVEEENIKGDNGEEGSMPKQLVEFLTSQTSLFSASYRGALRQIERVP